MNRKFVSLGVATLLLSGMAGVSWAQVAVNETFDEPAPSFPDADYPGWTSVLNNYTAAAEGGQLELNSTGAGNGGAFSAISYGGDVPLTVQADVGGVSDPTGFYNVGVIIGDVHFRYHPGYSTGAFQVQQVTPGGDNGGTFYQNTGDIGFDATMAELSVRITPSGTDYTYSGTLTNRDNTSEIYAFSGTIPAAAFGVIDSAGIYSQNGGSEPREAIGDNFSATAVPEPAALSLLGLGGLALARRRRR